MVMKNEDKRQLLLAIFLVLITIIVIIFYLIQGQNKSDNKILLVSDHNDFFTVESCIYRTLTYVKNGDIEKLNLVLSDKYKNSENIIEMFPSFTANKAFKAKKMFYEELSENVNKYYVYGNVLGDYPGENDDEKEEAYFILYLDSKNNTFSIEPYDGEIFMDGDNNG